MKTRLLAALLAVACCASATQIMAQDNGNNTPPPTPPVATKNPKAQTFHGEDLTDNYFWLREKSSKEVISYLEAENAYADAMTKDLAPFQD